MKNKSKKRVLRKWVVNVLSAILFGYIMFCGTTIDSITIEYFGLYDKILIIWTLLSILSFYLLYNYSNVFEEKEDF